MKLEEHPEMERLANNRILRWLTFLGSQPRDKAAMSEVNTITLFREEFTWK